jgi:hypothetical protein
VTSFCVVISEVEADGRLPTSSIVHIASFRRDGEFGRYRGIADMAGLAGGPTPSRMTLFRPRRASLRWYLEKVSSPHERELELSSAIAILPRHTNPKRRLQDA